MQVGGPAPGRADRLDPRRLRPGRRRTPVYFALTPAKVSGIAAARRLLPVEPGATYVFDLGDHDFSWFAKLRDQGCIFGTRLKSSTRLREVRPRAAAPGGQVVSDRTGRLPERLSSTRRNPFADERREVVVAVDETRAPRLFTNDLDSPAEAIAELYKERRQIELFFKRIKQNLRTARFMGTSENAALTQIATAFIAYMLVRVAQARLRAAHAAAIVLTVVRGRLFTRRSLADLLDPPPVPRPPPDPRLALFPGRAS